MKQIIRLTVAGFFMFAAIQVQAQIFNPKKLLEKKAADKANKVINKTADEVLDPKKANKKEPEQKKDNQPPQQSPTTNDQSTNDQQVKPGNSPTLQAYSKFDFIPGEKVIFYDDFSQDNVGDFPAAWNTNGSGEVVTTNLFPGKWMQFIGRNAIWTDALLKLPENYTIEFDAIPIAGEQKATMMGYEFRLMQSINAKAYDPGSMPGKAAFNFGCEYFGRPHYRSYIVGPEGEGLGLNGVREDDELQEKINQLYHISVWIQKSRVRLYQNQNKLFDLPRAFPVASVKMDRLRFEDGAVMFSNVRVAVGAPDMRNKLLTEGKIVSYGIYFDVNKDVVKPESYGSLKEIAAVLKDNEGVRIKVVGHTDADGADDANLDLSKRRAAAVKNELVNSFGIDASRIETDGKGETQPVASNDTPVNKALNRRVEFIKL